MIRRLPLLALFALAACGEPPVTTSPPPAEAPAPAPTPAPTPTPAGVTATNAGVGPITATTAFDRDAIAALFPGSEVKAAFLAEEGAQTPIITIFGPNELGIEIKQGATKGKIGEILAQGGPVAGPKGEQLLATFSSLGLQATDCVLGADRFSGAALCRSAAEPNLAYVVGARGELKGNPGDTPDAAELSAKGFLREFLWQAPK